MNRKIVRQLAAACAAVAFAGASADADVLYQENFNSLPLGPKVEEVTPGEAVWTKTPPAGWVKDDTGVPGFDQPASNNGVTEWIGWTFADKAWWVAAAGDQTRGQFANATGTVMIADADEWDDQPHPGKTAGFPANLLYNARITTGAISLANVDRGTVRVAFDSSWRPEAFDDGANVNNQTAIVEAIYSNGATADVTRWDSDPAGTIFKGDMQNEHINVALANIPAGAQSFQLRFTLGKAANDWWWAVDNVSVTGTVVPEPTTAGLALLGAGIFLKRRRR